VEPQELRDDQVLFSESCGRFLVTLAPSRQKEFEGHLQNLPRGRIGRITREAVLRVRGRSGALLIEEPLEALRQAWMVSRG